MTLTTEKPALLGSGPITTQIGGLEAKYCRD